MKLFKIVLTALLLLGIATGIAFAYSPRFRLFTFVLTGRSPVCPLRLALDSQAHLDRLKEIKDRILVASHLTAEKDGLELWDTPKGPYWIPKGNRYVLPFNLAEMEAHIYGSGEHFVRDGDVVLDCGASDGDFSRQALNAGAKLVVAIEISAASVECLRRNLAQEIAVGRAIVYPKGVWDKNDTLALSVSDENFAANSVVFHAPGGHATVQAQLTTIAFHWSISRYSREVAFKSMHGTNVPGVRLTPQCGVACVKRASKTSWELLDFAEVALQISPVWKPQPSGTSPGYDYTLM